MHVQEGRRHVWVESDDVVREDQEGRVDHDRHQHHHGGEGRPVPLVEPTQPDHVHPTHQGQLALAKAQIQLTEIGCVFREKGKNGDDTNANEEQDQLVSIHRDIR